MYNFVRSKKVFFWHIILLLLVKASFAYPLLWLTTSIGDQRVFTSVEIVSDTNAYRKELGLSEVKENTLLTQAAQKKLDDMVQNQYFAHTSPQKVTPWYWMSVANYKYLYAGENLAIGFESSKEAVNAWKNSPSHRRNLVSTNFTEIGVAVKRTNIDGIDGILVVQMFASPVKAKTVATKSVAVVKPKSNNYIAPIVPKKVTAAPSITPTPTPEKVQIALGDSEQIEKEDVAIPVISGSTLRINDLTNKMNSILMYYTFILAIVSVIYMLRSSKTSNVSWISVWNIAIFVLVILIPGIPIQVISFIR